MSKSDFGACLRRLNATPQTRCSNQPRNEEKLTSFLAAKAQRNSSWTSPLSQTPPEGNTIHRAKGFISNHSLDARVSLCPLLSAGRRCKSIPDQAALAAAAAAATTTAAAPSTGREEGGREGAESPVLNVKPAGPGAQSMSPVASL